jgi:arylsulfatase A-like enzyme
MAGMSGLAAGLSLRIAQGLGAEAPKPRPNVLLILVDDLGWGDLTSYGADDLKTPNVDRIVAQGMRSDTFYASAPVCSPTRAALMTGRYPQLVGVPGVIRTDPKNSWGYLSPEALMLPELLKKAGYATALIGKWHLGLQSPNLPNERGFDLFHGFLGDMMNDYFTHVRDGKNYMRRNAQTIDPTGHATDLFSQWACDYLKEPKAHEPFFLYLAYNAPHDPIQPPAEWLDRVKQRRPELDARRAKLVALIEHLDAGIGRVLDTLEKSGLSDQTLVIFTSDNGGALNAGARNGALRAGKGTMYEGGLRVPMAARWPGRIKPGARSDRVALTMDLMPTVLEAAGVPIQHEIDGRSLLPTLLGQQQPSPPRDLFWGMMEGGRLAGGTIDAIRRGDWKLLRQKPAGPPELYNLADDPLEKTNLAGPQPQRAAELLSALEAQHQRYDKVPFQPPRQ